MSDDERPNSPRVTALQKQLADTERKVDALQDRLSSVEDTLPETWLLHNHFLKRAVAVLGHQIVAYMLFSVPIWILAVIVLAVVGSLSP